MTQEALKMALDALETELSIDWGNQDEFNASAEKMYEAIAAIKEALAQQDYERGFVDGMQKQMQSSVDKAVNRMAQPEQEFVADDFFRMIADRNPKPFSSLQRTWVGLTDDEIAQAIESINMLHGDYATEVAYAIEAKLKEKNNG